ncbi:MAG: hypothetical protein WC241_01535 [Candidatus Paceibacterota bacterium]|jgi:hypothetical protein
MKKYIFIIIIIIIICLGAYFYFTKYSKKNIPSNLVNVSGEQAVATGVDKTNPFNVDVNPYQGYKNPFK